LAVYSLENSPFLCVADRRSVEYLANISAKGTSASTTV
jgi:hypothetical protein